MNPMEQENQSPISLSAPEPVEALPAKTSGKKRRILKILIPVLIILIAGGIFAGVSIAMALGLKTPVQSAQTHANAAASALKNQDLPTAKVELAATKEQLMLVQNGYRRLAFWNISPLHWHYQDGVHALNAALSGVEAGQLVVDTIEPYADVLGFKGVTAAETTAEDRIAKIIETVGVVVPKLDEIQQKIAVMDGELNSINPHRYPFSIKGHKVDALIESAKQYTHEARTALTEFRPAIEKLPQVAGVDMPKTYLILFQNDGELRPTGGFMTAYAIVKVEKGKVTPVKSDDIYTLDGKFKQRVAAPDPIKKYLKNVPYWYLRDMNLSPDFKVSMDTFSQYYSQIKDEPKIDGIIAVDTKLLTDLVKTLGPVDVPGYGVFTAETEPRCDCAQIVYALENMITRPTPYARSDRKGVLGPLMQALLQKAYLAPKEVNPLLFQTAIQSVNQKHVLFYFFDQSTQAAAESINVAGRLKAFDADYFEVNDANFGGAKSNMFVTQEVEQEIKIENGQVTKTVTLKYKNPRKSDNCNLEAGQLCLNGRMPTWTRVYIPKGSVLKESLGFADGSVKTSEDLDKTVIEGYFELNPESQATIKLTYTIPYQPQKEYRLLIQKQPGVDMPKYTVVVGSHREEFNLSADKELKLGL